MVADELNVDIPFSITSYFVVVIFRLTEDDFTELQYFVMVNRFSFFKIHGTMIRGKT